MADTTTQIPTGNPMTVIPEAVGNVGVGLYKFIEGRRQQKAYEEMIKNLMDPIYQIPTEATNALNQSKSLAESKQFAGQTQAEQKLDQSVANATSQAVRTATSPQELLAAVTQINANEMSAKNDLMEKAADDYLNRQMNLAGERKSYAAYEDKKQERDIYDKFYRDSAAASALRESAMRNQFGGFEQMLYGGAKGATSFIPAATSIPVG